MKVILSGGGTAGHINPALAIARGMAADFGAEVLFVGTPRGMENRLVGEAGFPIAHVDVEGLSRKLTPHNVKVAWKYLRSVGRAKRLIRSFAPDVVVGTGGYVCAPVLKAAAKLGIPTLIHEQNVIPGMTVRMLSKVTSRVAVSFEETIPLLGTPNCVFTGNPLRQELFSHTYADARRALGLDERPYVVMFGGSLGAERMNAVLIDYVRHADTGGIQLLAGTGTKHYDAVMAAIPLSAQTSNITIRPYIDNMGEVMAAADLLICRAGAITISEICALGKASILIPSPYVAHNHQEHNARALEEKGACRVILEQALTWEALDEAISDVLHSEAHRKKMQLAAKKMGVADATQKLCQLAAELAKQ